jgi:cytochrome P450
LIIAGSETSATLLSGCVFYLCRDSTVMHKLVGEIRSTFLAAEEITFTKTAKLAYLSAVIEESLRMYPPFATSLARVVPSGGASVAGDWIPENVILRTILTPKLL